jgi:hypothetical protein
MDFASERLPLRGAKHEIRVGMVVPYGCFF